MISPGGVPRGNYNPGVNTQFNLGFALDFGKKSDSNVSNFYDHLR